MRIKTYILPKKSLVSGRVIDKTIIQEATWCEGNDTKKLALRKRMLDSATQNSEDFIINESSEEERAKVS